MTKYEQYNLHICNQVPESDFEIIIRTLIKEAEIDMGTDFDEVAIPRLLSFISKDYGHLPMYSIAGAFKKGALGQYGPGRLIPRTIYGWLSEMSIVYLEKSKNLADKIDVKRKWDGLHKYACGKAICRKIDWLKSGVIDDDGWDRIPLKELAEREARGLESYPEMFGVKGKE